MKSSSHGSDRDWILCFGHAYFWEGKKSPSLVIKHRSVNAHELKRRGEGRRMFDDGGGVSLTYITVQIFNCIFSIVKQRQGCLMARTNLMSDHCPPVRLYSMREHGDEWRHRRHGAANYQSLLRNNKAKPLGWRRKKNLVESAAFHIYTT